MSIDGNLGRTWIHFNTLQSNPDGYEKASNVLLHPSRLLFGRNVREVKAGEYEALPIVSKVIQVLVAIGFVLFSPLLIPLTIAGVILEKCSTTHAETDKAYRLFCQKTQKPEDPSKPEPSPDSIKKDQEWIDRIEQELLERQKNLNEVSDAKPELCKAVLERLKANPKAVNALIYYTHLASQSYPNLLPAFDDALKHVLTEQDGALNFEVWNCKDDELAYFFKQYGSHAKAVDMVRQAPKSYLTHQKLLNAIFKNDISQINPQLISAVFEELAKLDKQPIFRMEFPEFEKLSLESRLKIYPSAAKLARWNNPREYTRVLLPEFEQLPPAERTRLAPVFFTNMPEVERQEWIEDRIPSVEMVVLMSIHARELCAEILPRLFSKYCFDGSTAQNEMYFKDLMTQASPDLSTQIIRAFHMNVGLRTTTLFASLFETLTQIPARLEHLIKTMSHSELFVLLKLLQGGNVTLFLKEGLQKFLNELKKQNKYSQVLSQARRHELEKITAGATSEDIQWLVSYFFKLKEEQQLVDPKKRKEAEELDFEFDEPSLYYLFKGITLGQLIYDRPPEEALNALKYLEGMTDGLSMMPTAFYGVVRAYERKLRSLWGPLPVTAKDSLARRREQLKNTVDNLEIFFKELNPASRKVVAEAIKLRKAEIMDKLKANQSVQLMDLIFSVKFPWTEDEIHDLIDYAPREYFGYAFIHMTDKNLQLKTFQKITQDPESAELVEILKRLFTKEEAAQFLQPGTVVKAATVEEEETF